MRKFYPIPIRKIIHTRICFHIVTEERLWLVPVFVELVDGDFAVKNSLEYFPDQIASGISRPRG